MKNYLTIKHFNNYRVRIIRYRNEYYFLGNDVAKILGYKLPRKAVLDHVDSDDRVSLSYRDCSKTELRSLWGKYNHKAKKFINESGVYALIFGSKLPEAKKFKHWVTHEVLPSIRKTGSYGNNKLLHAPKSQLFLTLYKQSKHVERLEQEDKDHQKLERVFRSTKTNVPIGQVAKVISNTGHFIGRNKFFKWMRHHKYLISRGRQYNVPYQYWIERGLFKVTEHVISDANNILATTVLVTPKGQQYLVKHYLKWVKNND